MIKEKINKGEKITFVTGGGGGYGQFEYDSKTGVMTEMGEVGSGNWGGDSFFPPRSNKGFHDVTFYNDDLFIQIDRESRGMVQVEGATGRGVVYRRIK